MMPLWMVLYFALACGLGAWVLLPGVRSAALRGAMGLVNRLGGSRPAARQAPTVGPPVKATLAAKAPARSAVSHQIARRWHLAVAAVAVLLLILPPLGVWWAGPGQGLSGFDDHARRAEPEVVTALLQGEQLVPPPVLPPALFTTPEVETVRPQLALADRRWEQFDPQFRQRLLWVYKVMKEEHGYDMVLLEGYRSPERQTLLSKLGPSVTNAGAWQSYHQYGLAADSAFLRNGKLVISERDPWAMQGYELYGRVALRAGLVWGGRWQNADLGHVELRGTRKERP